VHLVDVSEEYSLTTENVRQHSMCFHPIMYRVTSKCQSPKTWENQNKIFI